MKKCQRIDAPFGSVAYFTGDDQKDQRTAMIDEEGYRLNVGIVLCNDEGRLFWGRRIGMNSWQFPQGGIRAHEDPTAAMFRELYEEVGLAPEDVEIIGRTRRWLYYDLPTRFIRRESVPICIGQKQLWFILRLVGTESNIRFDCSDKPEFDAWCWVDYWRPIHDVVYFKRDVYRRALIELGRYLMCDGVPVNPKGYLSARRFYSSHRHHMPVIRKGGGG